MKIGFDGGIKLEFHGAKVTSDGGLIAHRDLDDALGLFDSVSEFFTDKAKGVTPNMRYPLSCVNLSTVVLPGMKMSMTPSVYQLIPSCERSPGKRTMASKQRVLTRWDALKQ